MGVVLTQNKDNTVEPTLHWEGLLLLEKSFLIFSNQHWLRSWYNRNVIQRIQNLDNATITLNLTVLSATCSWALLIYPLRWKHLASKTLHYARGLVHSLIQKNQTQNKSKAMINFNLVWTFCTYETTRSMKFWMKADKIFI